ncbi:MAG: ATP-binding protein, partial [Acidobacteriota bacterium]
RERMRLVTAVEQVADPIVITDERGSIQYVNPAFSLVTNFQRNEIIGRSFRMLETDARERNVYRAMLRTVTRGQVWSGPIGSRMKDGSMRHFYTTISPLRDRNGTVVSYVSVNRDVTHEIALEAQLRQSQKMEAIGTLAGGIAHDFNNILGVILGFTELALLRLKPKEPIYEALQSVVSAGLRAKDLVRQILVFSHPAQEERQPLRIGTIIKEAIKMLRASLPTTIEVSCDIESSTATVMADPTQIHQVIMNLCTNAFHAMHDTGGMLSVKLEDVDVDLESVQCYPGLRPGAYVRLTVSDTGHGMTSEVAERIFEPYFTTKEKGKGTGLGLAMVHGIVRSHGGTVLVRSEVNRGSTFSVMLPRIEQVPAAAKDDLDPVPKGTESILLVDDEQVLTEINKELLQLLGYRVTTATSAMEALDLFAREPARFQLVITDMTMPKMTGAQLAERLLEIRPGLPILLCTGFSELIDKEKARAIGIRELILKPLRLLDLAKTIREALDTE